MPIPLFSSRGIFDLARNGDREPEKQGDTLFAPHRVIAKVAALKGLDLETKEQFKSLFHLDGCGRYAPGSFHSPA